MQRLGGDFTYMDEVVDGSLVRLMLQHFARQCDLESAAGKSL
jgi:hypothetical protein